MSSEVAQAKILLRNKANHYTLKGPHTKTTSGILFNADKFIVSATNIPGFALNRQRAQS